MIVSCMSGIDALRLFLCLGGQKRSRASAAAAAVASAMAELGQEQIIEEASPVGKDVSKIKEGGGAVVNSTSSSSSSKPPKKKAKIKKRSVVLWLSECVSKCAS